MNVSKMDMGQMDMGNMSIGIMIIISMIAGFLATMNVFAVKWSHMRIHLNDVYMITLMTGWMSLFMALSTPHFTYKNYVIIGSALVIGFALYCIRKQVFIDDKQFLNGMIPHHSMALKMALGIKEKTKDQRIQKLADNIIKGQSEEIKLMDEILKDK